MRNIYDELSLFSFGDVIPLKQIIDTKELRKELKPYNDQWKTYNKNNPNNRYGLSLTSFNGELSGDDLDSILDKNYKESDFNQKTDVYKSCQSLHNFFENFDEVGRTHFIRLNKGGFFPPHRDNVSYKSDCIRILIFCFNCHIDEFNFVYENDRILNIETGIPYIINTRKTHSVFSFVDNSVQLVSNIPLTENNKNFILNSFRET